AVGHAERHRHPPQLRRRAGQPRARRAVAERSALMFRARRAFAIALAAWVLACAPEAHAQGGLPTREIEIGVERFLLEVAANPASQFRGLGGRTVIPRNGGMLFVNRSPRPLAFVMRDCPIPIDIAYLDADGRVLNVHT